MSRSLDSYFSDWEAEAFGFGYGTGEQYILPALRRFLGLCRNDGFGYDYAELEVELGSTVAWLMINALCKDGVVEYGVSPRFGWLDERGKRRSPDDFGCGKTACNCGPNGYEEGRVCPNPFWAGVGGKDRA